MSPASRLFTPFTRFSREEWARHRADTPLTLGEEDLDKLRGINVELDLEEIIEIYLPLSRLLNLYIAARQDLSLATKSFLNHRSDRVPFVIGLAGSVAVGKSTTARILQALLSRWPNHPTVELVTTDGFLYSNEFLKKRGLMDRKGFPESYNTHRLLEFITDVKAGRDKVQAPVYSHVTYDVIPDEALVIENPDIMIVEGLNVLQGAGNGNESIDRVTVSDYFDFSIYVDAPEPIIREWYVERFIKFRKTAFRQKKSYFHQYADLDESEARNIALDIWQTINEVNLHQNILPTRRRADLILRKRKHHSVEQVLLRKI